VCGSCSRARPRAGERFDVREEARAARSIAAFATLTSSWAALIVAGLVVAACSGGGGGMMDAGHDRDGTVLDSTLSVDDASRDAIVADAAALDAGGAPACGGACDPRDVAACTGGHCVITADGPACGADAGTSLAGASCEHTTDCGPGLSCFADSAAGLGVCAEVCCPGDATCGAERRCGGSGELVSGAITAWARCLPIRPCDLGHPELVCAAREGCYIVDAEGHTECLIAGTALEGEPCNASNDCAAFGVCTGIVDRTCARVCLLDMPRDCGADRRCEAQAYSPPGTGICTPSVI
jgi:hypothetical protein